MKRVLVADDHPGFLDMLVATLGGDDTYQMSLAKDSQEALELAQQEMPDLVLLDVRMPRLDGLAVCRALKSSDETSGIMVLMLSGLSDESDLHEAMKAGADGYFTKPFSPTALLVKLEELLS